LSVHGPQPIQLNFELYARGDVFLADTFENTMNKKGPVCTGPFFLFVDFYGPTVVA